MNQALEKRYGLWTAVSMVVGVVIGSGVFFKAEKILAATNGDLTTGIIAWLIGGAIMVSCAYVFALLATKYSKVNGIVDYAEAALGETFGYIVGWFMATMYYPTLTAVLAWISAKYTSIILGFDNPDTGVETFLLAGFFMVAIYALNALAPKLAGRFQVSTTVIKIIPLALIAVVGVVKGFSSGQTMENFTATITGDVTGNPLLTSVVATAFAYEGWIIATTINAELKDPKKNLPKALMIGTTFVVGIYVLYFIGINGALPVQDLMAGGEDTVQLAYSTLLGSTFGSLLFVFVTISCIGTLNGLTLGNARGFYSLAARGMGPAPKVFKQVDGHTGIPTNSAVMALLVSAFWLVVWYGNFAGWLPNDNFFDISELPIVAMYLLYIPIFIFVLRNMKELNVFNRYVMPLVAIAGSAFMLFAAYKSHGNNVFYFLALWVVFTAVGLAFKGKAQDNLE